VEKALQKVSKLLGRRTAQALRARLKRVGKMPGANRLFKQIMSAPDEDQLGDYLAEVKYALIFAGLGFQVEVDPKGKKGPDLGISRNGHYAVVEVTRFRKVHSGPPMLDMSDKLSTLQQYGNPPRDIRKSIEKILNKLRQVQNGESIIAIWNDDEDLEEVEVQEAVEGIRDEAAQGILTLPNGLLFVLYGSNRIGQDGRQLYCFPIHYSAQEHQQLWQQELESSTVEELVQRALTQVAVKGSFGAGLHSRSFPP